MHRTEGLGTRLVSPMQSQTFCVRVGSGDETNPYATTYTHHRSPYTLFLKDNFDQIDRLEDGRLNLKLLGKMWRSLDKEEKEVIQITECVVLPSLLTAVLTSKVHKKGFHVTCSTVIWILV